MRINLFKISVAALGLSLLALVLPGCGGGSIGTGIKPVGWKDLPDDKFQPSWLPDFSTNSCTYKSIAGDLSLKVKSEVGFAAPINRQSDSCAFILPKQARMVSVLSAAFEGLSQAPYRMDKVSCVDGKVTPVLLGTLAAQSGRLELTPKALSWADNIFLRLTLMIPERSPISLELYPEGSKFCNPK